MILFDISLTLSYKLLLYNKNSNKASVGKVMKRLSVSFTMFFRNKGVGYFICANLRYAKYSYCIEQQGKLYDIFKDPICFVVSK